jgi:lysine-arginine-ornithine-binding protein
MKSKLIALIVLSVALGLSNTASFAADKLRIAVEGAYPPFSWKEADGTLKGFDIDIANAVCAKLGRECALIEQDWDGMIPALLARKFDVIIASMSITAERKKKVDFTVKYYHTPAMVVAKKGAGFEASKAGLKDKRIGVQRSTTHQCYAEKFFGDAEIVLYATQEEVFQDLASGRLDAQLSDSLQALEGFLNKDAGKDFAFLGEAQKDLPCLGEGAGFAVRKQDTQLRDKLNAAIVALRADGTYKSLNDKFFKIDIYGD